MGTQWLFEHDYKQKEEPSLWHTMQVLIFHGIFRVFYVLQQPQYPYLSNKLC